MSQSSAKCHASAAAHVTLDAWTLEGIMTRGRSVSAQGDGGAHGDPLSPQKQVAACGARVVSVERAVIETNSFGYANLLLDVRDGLAWPIAGIRISHRTLSEGRSVPWIETGFVMKVPGGIEPSEVRQIGTSARPPRDAPDELDPNYP